MHGTSQGYYDDDEEQLCKWKLIPVNHLTLLAAVQACVIIIIFIFVPVVYRICTCSNHLAQKIIKEDFYDNQFQILFGKTKHIHNISKTILRFHF